MAKKHKRGKLLPPESAMGTISSHVEDNRPEISPYAQSAWIFRIGLSGREFTVSDFLLKQSPTWSAASQSCDFFERAIHLPQVDEDIGHTLVHYLYSGTYQTLKPHGSTGPPNSTIEYRRAMLAYCTARLYTLEGLAAHAVENMRLFGKELSIIQILEITSEVYCKLPEDEAWFPNYLKAQVQDAFALKETIFKEEAFLHQIGKEPTFSRTLAKIMVDTMMTKSTIMPENDVAVTGRERVVSEDLIAEENLSLRPPLGKLPADETKDNFRKEAATVVSTYNDLEDFPQSPPPPPPPLEEVAEVDDTFDDISVPIVPEATNDGPSWSSRSSLDASEVKTSVERSALPSLSLLDGLLCEPDGTIRDYSGKFVGQVYEGHATQFSKKMFFCDGCGNVVDYQNIPVGKCRTVAIGEANIALEETELVPEGGPDLAKEIPLLSFAQPTLASLEGRTIEGNGDVIDHNGKTVGRVVEGASKIPQIVKVNGKCDGLGNVVARGRVVPRVKVAMVLS